MSDRLSGDRCSLNSYMKPEVKALLALLSDVRPTKRRIIRLNVKGMEGAPMIAEKPEKPSVPE